MDRANLYIILGGVFFIGSTFLTVQKFEEQKVEFSGTIVTMEILHIDYPCLGTKAKYSMKLKYENMVFYRQIGAGFCEKYKVGDTIQMKYLEGKDIILFPHESLKSHIFSGFFLVIFGLYVIYLGFKEKRKRKV